MFDIRILEGLNEIKSIGVHGFRYPNWYFITLSPAEASGVSDFNSLVISATGDELTPPGMINLDVPGEVIGEGLLVFLAYEPEIIPSPYTPSTSYGRPAVIAAEVIIPETLPSGATYGQPAVTSNYQAIIPNSLNNTALHQFGLPSVIGESETIIVAEYEGSASYGEPAVIESKHLSIPYIPRWMDPAYPNGSNIARLVHSMVLKPSKWTLQPLADQSISIFGRTDTDLEYWQVDWSEEIETLTLDGEEIPFVTNISDGLYYPRPAWTQRGNSVFVFWGNLTSTSQLINTWSDVQNLLPSQYTGRVYLRDSNNQMNFLDSQDNLTIAPDHYTISWIETDKEVKINGKVVSPRTLKWNDRWDEYARLWCIDRELDQIEMRGKLQALQYLESTNSKIAASLFDLETFWWTGQADLIASGTTAYDFPLQELEIIDESLTYSTPTIYYSMRTPVNIEITYNNDVIDPSLYSVTGNEIEFTFVPKTAPQARYTSVRMESKGDLVIGTDGLPDRYYPVFALRSTTLATQPVKREKFIWDKIRLKNSSQSLFL